MKLYLSPGACSMASHIALIEANLPHTIEKVDIKKHVYAGGDYYQVNPKGSVPVLELSDGRRITENVAILQYIADQAPQAKLTPPYKEFEHYRLQEWLGNLASDIHKSFSPLFNPAITEEEKKKAIEKLKKVMAHPARALEDKKFLLGDHVSVADFYLYVMMTWAKKMGLKLTESDSIDRFMERMAERPAVKEAAAREGKKEDKN